MPKKFKGENSKAVEARQRKAAAEAEKVAAKQKAVEDAYWEDDDKHIQRKQQRKEDKEKKRQEQLDKKKEKEALLAEEMASLKAAKPAPSGKVTRAQIESNKDKLASEVAKERARQSGRMVTDEDDGPPIEENINRMVVDGDEARNIDEAISVLGKADAGIDLHPEKRMKAAYKAYEDQQLPILKAENPNMRLSQLKQMIKKDWMKAPENPMIQAQMARLRLNSK